MPGEVICPSCFREGKRMVLEVIEPYLATPCEPGDSFPAGVMLYTPAVMRLAKKYTCPECRIPYYVYSADGGLAR